MRGFLLDGVAKKTRFVSPTDPLIVAPEGRGDLVGIQPGLRGQVFKQQLGQERKGDAVPASDPFVQPVAPAHETGERRLSGAP